MERAVPSSLAPCPPGGGGANKQGPGIGWELDVGDQGSALSLSPSGLASWGLSSHIPTSLDGRVPAEQSLVPTLPCPGPGEQGEHACWFQMHFSACSAVSARFLHPGPGFIERQVFSMFLNKI